MAKRTASRDEVPERTARAERLVQARIGAGFKGAVSAATHFRWQENTYKAHESGRNGFGLADAKKYAAAFGVRAAWLNFNESPMYEGHTRIALGDEFPPDPDPDQPATIGQNTGGRGYPRGTVPQVDVTAGMGAGGLTLVLDGVRGKDGQTFAAEHVSDYWRFPGAVINGLGLKTVDIAILPVQGDSMATTLIEGDFVLVDIRHRLPSPDGLYALGDEFGGIIVKRLEVASGRDDETIVRVISDNPRHAAKERPLSELNIVGRVLRKFGNVG